MGGKSVQQDARQIVVKPECRVQVVAAVLMISVAEERLPRVHRTQTVLDADNLAADEAGRTQWIGERDCFPDGAVAAIVGTRREDVFYLGGQLQRGFEVFRDLKVEIGAKVVACAAWVYVMVVVDFRVFVNALLVEVARGDKVFHPLGAAGNVEIVLRAQRSLPQKVFRPVHVRVQYRIGSVPIELDVFVGELRYVGGP